MTGARTTGFRHVAFACRDGEETRHFYADLLGMPLIHTEVKKPDAGGFFRSLFFDTEEAPARLKSTDNDH